MFYVGYMLSELRRRAGRTVLTALAFAVGIALVVAVSALSRGLDRAQASVLEPLTGVGTDLAVTRPLNISDDDSSPGAFAGGPVQLSPSERKALERENGEARIGLRDLGEPGSHFSRDNFIAATQLSFPESRVREVRGLDGVEDAAGSLTLTALHVEGTVPEQPPEGRFRAGGAGPPENIDFSSFTVTGVDQSKPALGAVTPGQVAGGRYFSAGGAREAIVNVSYAQQRGLSVGDTVKVGGKSFRIVGLAETPLGGQASDVYMKLSQLQALSGRKGRVNTLQVRAESGDRVDSVAKKIEASFPGSRVTTADELAERVSGSLIDAKNLAGTLGTALVLLALLGACLVASLLTLSSVAKRVRELGTLKALGWPKRLVVRQVTGEALMQGLLGGVLGVALGLGAAALISGFGPTLEATAEAAAGPGPGAGSRGMVAFGQGAISSGSQTVSLDAPVDAVLVLLAVGLALLGGLVAGAAGGLRAARLRPAEALRHID
jgi:ABC-type antimicrobial peptide transport system permease subunit